MDIVDTTKDEHFNQCQDKAEQVTAGDQKISSLGNEAFYFRCLS